MLTDYDYKFEMGVTGCSKAYTTMGVEAEEKKVQILGNSEWERIENFLLTVFLVDNHL